jgi:hypothetical protein
MRHRSVTLKPLFKSTLSPEAEAVAMAIAKIKPLPMKQTSAGIVIPNERSIKQRNFAFCRNPECAEEGCEFRFEVEHTLNPCPKCGADRAPFVGMLAKIHLLVRDRKGPLVCAGGLRYRMACDTEYKRGSISTTENHELGSGAREVCNCVDCLVQADKINVGEYTGSRFMVEGK